MESRSNRDVLRFFFRLSAPNRALASNRGRMAVCVCVHTQELFGYRFMGELARFEDGNTNLKTHHLFRIYTI